MRLLLGMVVLALTACTVPTQTATPDLAPGAATTAPPYALIGVVERIVDGDTLIAEVDGERERIRLLRIDTPELEREGQPAECLAEAATATLEALVPPGTTIDLATDVEVRDRFDRLLAHVWVDDTWVNGAMLDAGFADVLTIPPNVAYDDEVLAAVRRAREAQAGLWDPTVC